LNVKNSIGRTILQELCTIEEKKGECKIELIKLLLESKAKPNDEYYSLSKSLQDDITPLFMLVNSSKPNYTKINLILKSRGDPNLSNRFLMTPFHYLCKNKMENVELLKLMIEHKARLNTSNRQEITPLMDIVKNQHYSSLFTCIFNHPNPFGYTNQEVYSFFFLISHQKK
jgi:ankyrin repeat protein